jgi:hypothetical protein
MLTCNIGQQIIFGDQMTSVGGYLASTKQNDNVTVECIEPNLIWTVSSSIGDITIA